MASGPSRSIKLFICRIHSHCKALNKKRLLSALAVRENAPPSQQKQQHGNTIKISGGKAGEPNQGVAHK